MWEHLEEETFDYLCEDFVVVVVVVPTFVLDYEKIYIYTYLLYQCWSDEGLIRFSSKTRNSWEKVERDYKHPCYMLQKLYIVRKESEVTH